MVELIKFFADAIAKALPGISEARRRKRRTGLGAELFLLYVRLNEVTLAAERVIDDFEEHAKRIQIRVDRGYDLHVLRGKTWITASAEVQALNLARVGDLLLRSREVLQAMDADSYNRITRILEWKRGTLQILLRTLRSGRFPLLSEDLEVKANLSVERHSVSSRPPVADDVLMPPWRARILPPVDEVWGPEAHAEVVRYLREGKPREQLGEIRTALESMRAALEQHFSLDDVLLEVGDSRFQVM
jgi:hypothetical protein